MIVTRYKWGKIVHLGVHNMSPAKYTEITDRKMKLRKKLGLTDMEFAREHDICCVARCAGMSFPYCARHDAP